MSPVSHPFLFCQNDNVERIAEVIASGEEFEDEPEEEYIIPPDNLLGRRKSCF